MRACSFLIILLLASRVEAHGLHARHVVLPGKRIQIQGWYDTDEPANGATVRVLRPDGSIVAEGQLDGKGLWDFPFPEASELRVLIKDGGAHQAKLTITASELAAPIPWREMLTGVGFLLALAAFILSLRNAKALRELRRQSTDKPPS